MFTLNISVSERPGMSAKRKALRLNYTPKVGNPTD